LTPLLPARLAHGETGKQSNKLPTEFLGNLLGGCKVRLWRPAFAQAIKNLIGFSVTDSSKAANVGKVDFPRGSLKLPALFGGIGFHTRGESDRATG